MNNFSIVLMVVAAVWTTASILVIAALHVATQRADRDAVRRRSVTSSPRLDRVSRRRTVRPACARTTRRLPAAR